VKSVFVSGLSIHFRVFGPHWGDKVRNSGHDKGVGVLEVGKHHLDMLTLRLEKTPMWMTDGTHDLTWTWVEISCTFYRHVFGGEEVGRCSLASDNKLPSIGLKVLKKGYKLETDVYRKPRNTGLLLHQRQNHFDKRYKKSQAQSTNENAVHRVVLPFKDQKSANAVRKQLSDLSNKVNHILQLVLKSRKILEDFKMWEPKPPIIRQPTMRCVQL